MSNYLKALPTWSELSDEHEHISRCIEDKDTHTEMTNYPIVKGETGCNNSSTLKELQKFNTTILFYKMTRATFVYFRTWLLLVQVLFASIY